MAAGLAMHSGKFYQLVAAIIITIITIIILKIILPTLTGHIHHHLLTAAANPPAAVLPAEAPHRGRRGMVKVSQLKNKIK